MVSRLSLLAAAFLFFTPHPSQSRIVSDGLATPTPVATLAFRPGSWAPQPRTVSHEVPDPIASLLDRARGEPVEIFADLAFRLLEATKIPQNQKSALLEEVFERAPQAREPHPWSLAQPAYPNGPALARAQIQPLRLDALSLRGRAIQLLLAANPRHAVELFDQIPTIQLPPAACEDPYVASIDPLYETLLPVVTRGRFTPEEREKKRPLEMVFRRLRELRSPSEIAPASLLVRELVFTHNWPADDLVNAYASALASIQSDDRTFSFAIASIRALIYGLALGSDLRQRGASPVAIVSALRTFLGRHLSAARCADSYARLNPETANEKWRDAFLAERVFNNTLTLWQVTDVSPLTSDEVRPEKLTGVASDPPWQNAEDLYTLYRAINRLRTNGESEAWLSAAERQTPEWDQRAAPVLRRIVDFRGVSKMSANDVWLQRAGLWRALMDAAPPGSIFQSAVQGWIAEMSDARVRAEQPALWLVQFGFGFRLARSFSKEEARELEDTRKKIPGIRIPGLPHPSGAALLDAMRNAPDPALALYAGLEALAPKSHGGWAN